VAPGALFVPIRGKRFDGHMFVEQAFLHGASFSLVSRDADLSRMPRNVIVVRDTKRALGDLARWQRSRFDVPVIGVTGSCGKTTVKEMLRQVLGDGVVVSHASFNNDIGVPLTLLRMDRTTRAAVVEIGTSGPGEIAYLTNIARPTVGVLTTIEEAHLEGLGSVRGVMREKSALLHGLPQDGAAIVNADNYYCREILETLDHGTTITYGTWEDATVFGM
ncbi:MAG: UDP-N-acetylmuramoyl-tripeptide--D-alanyl-D-alanine ligase, partial [Rhodocyclaceae bacterium]|nr:UDP-N-acetylmuramoyl-tripeptide--D-alanyl-D-alanine ligase [Rhodocyclaceae bacterium]